MTTTAKAATSKPGFMGYLIGGVVAGIIAAILNNLWNLIYPAIGGVSVPDVINVGSVTLMSIMPLLIAAIGYFVLSRFMDNATPIFQGATIVLALLSLFGTFNPPMPVPDGFAGLSAPMHIIAGLVGAFVIPRFVK